MTPETLVACLDCPLYRAQKWAEPLTKAMEKYEINTPTRQAAFIAQIGHESGRLVYVREIWGPTPTQTRYEGRKDLGNTQAGDGFKFRGRGLIQVTGRDNYRKVGQALNLGLESTPELLEKPEWAAESAAWFWKDRGLNILADRNDFRTITRRINGGFNGYVDRLALWEKAKKVLGAG